MKEPAPYLCSSFLEEKKRAFLFVRVDLICLLGLGDARTSSCCFFHQLINIAKHLGPLTSILLTIMIFVRLAIQVARLNVEASVRLASDVHSKIQRCLARMRSFVINSLRHAVSGVMAQ
jgi:hypothetical protein